MSTNSEFNYEVLSPWAVVDPIPFRSAAPRVDDLDGKIIGLFRNSKRAAKPVLEVVERELAKKYPNATFNWFDSLAPNVLETETDNREAFGEWINSIDIAVLAVGD
ncbi:MAG: hypothetical protein JW712_05810 [Dehalococcoidales bacterium]|nr:hypothetical protein [Dehalococcoidales bacterium]